MDTLTISRKPDLLKRAELYHHTQIFLPDTKDYVRGFLHEPIGFKDYDSGKEPVVDAKELYALDDKSWLTINRYNALVLNTANMLIADIDFGDERLDRHAGATTVADVCENIGELANLDEHWFGWDDPDDDHDEFRFAHQTYRVYRTHSGCRVICTSNPMPYHNMGWLAERLMRFLRADPEYIKLCGVQNCYRARLTPKPWRENGELAHVCRLEDVVSLLGDDAPHPELVEQLRLHDEMTLPEKDWSQFA